MKFIQSKTGPFVTSLICFVLYQYVSSFKDDMGDNIAAVKPFMIFFGTAGIASLFLGMIKFFIRTISTQTRIIKEQQAQYSAWYNTLTFQERQLEDIRRNTARQANELQRLRNIAEQRERDNK